MIVGIGVDMVDSRRIAKSIERFGDRFLSRIFTDAEQAQAAGRADQTLYFAKRFAAKEAFSKALGTGIGRVVSFQDLTVRSNENGKPYFMPSEKLRLYLKEKGIQQGHLSISDESQNALAFVVLESED